MESLFYPWNVHCQSFINKIILLLIMTRKKYSRHAKQKKYFQFIFDLSTAVLCPLLKECSDCNNKKVIVQYDQKKYSICTKQNTLCYAHLWWKCNINLNAKYVMMALTIINCCPMQSEKNFKVYKAEKIFYNLIVFINEESLLTVQCFIRIQKKSSLKTEKNFFNFSHF